MTGIKTVVENHNDAELVEQGEGKITVAVPHTLPVEIDNYINENGLMVTRKTPILFEISTSA